MHLKQTILFFIFILKPYQSFALSAEQKKSFEDFFNKEDIQYSPDRTSMIFSEALDFMIGSTGAVKSKKYHSRINEIINREFFRILKNERFKVPFTHSEQELYVKLTTISFDSVIDFKNAEKTLHELFKSLPAELQEKHKGLVREVNKLQKNLLLIQETTNKINNLYKEQIETPNTLEKANLKASQRLYLEKREHMQRNFRFKRNQLENAIGKFRNDVHLYHLELQKTQSRHAQKLLQEMQNYNFKQNPVVQKKIIFLSRLKRLCVGMTIFSIADLFGSLASRVHSPDEIDLIPGDGIWESIEFTIEKIVDLNYDDAETWDQLTKELDDQLNERASHESN